MVALFAGVLRNGLSALAGDGPSLLRAAQPFLQSTRSSESWRAAVNARRSFAGASKVEDEADASSSAAIKPAARPQLTAEQKENLDLLVYKLQRPAALARKVATLGALAATYRDLYVVVDNLYRRDVMHLPSPLLGPPTTHVSVRLLAARPSPTASSSSSAADATQAQPPSGGSTAADDRDPLRRPDFPVIDVSLLPDGEQLGLELKDEHMDTQAVWAQLQPSHIEMSHQLLTAVSLFPPSEACHPTYVDFGAAMRLLDKHKSRKRVRLLKRLLRKQDKYQMTAHGHYSGQA